MIEKAEGSQAVVEEILFDARSLQAAAGICRRVSDYDVALLRALRHRDWPGVRPRLVGLVDASAEPLREHHRLFFDEVVPGRRRIGHRRRWFISTSPTLRDPVWASPILLDDGILKVGVLHEQISPGHLGERLSSLGRRADYLIALAWLGRYDLFIVGSTASKADLQRHRAVAESKIVVAGRAVRGELRSPPDDAMTLFDDRRHIAATIDGCDDSDLGCVLTAHALSMARTRLPLVLIGRCLPTRRRTLREVYAREGGDPVALRFAEDTNDRELGDLYRGALLTVVPRSGHETLVSSAVESAALGTPALVPEVEEPSDAAPAPVLRYPLGDHVALSRMLDAAAGDVALWMRARTAGLDRAEPATLEVAAQRVVDVLNGHASGRLSAPSLLRGARARLALLTPLSPTVDGSARRSSALIDALSQHVDVHVFSDTPLADPGTAARSLAPVHDLEGSVQPFDASLSVLGNSRRHASIFEYLLGNGGAAWVHDAHLLDFYSDAFGPGRTLEVARSEQGSDVSQERIDGWLREPHDMPLLFLSEVAKAAAPLLVTSETAKREAARAYGITPKRLPPFQHWSVRREQSAQEVRWTLREALGWRRDEIVLCSFGLSAAAASVAMWALRLLRDWGLDARLALGATSDDPDGSEMGRVARELGLHDWVIPVPPHLSEARYLDHLAAADIAVQLGTHHLSGPSEALMASIAAALPTVSNDLAADVAEAPGFVWRVADALSPVLVAEAALGIVSSGQHRLRPVDEALNFGETHSPAVFARAMAEALELDCGRS